MEWIESSKTLALKAQMPGDYPKNTIWNWILILRYFYSSEMGTTAWRPHLPSWYNYGHPLQAAPSIVTMLPRYVKNLTCSTCLPFSVNIRYVPGLTLISLVLNSFILSSTFAASFFNFTNLAFIPCHLGTNKRISLAKSRSSNLPIILHCTPLFLPFMTLFMTLCCIQH